MPARAPEVSAPTTAGPSAVAVRTSPTPPSSAPHRLLQPGAAVRRTRPAVAAPARKDASATTGPSTGNPVPPPVAAMPRMTTLPVMLPANTWSRRR